MCGFSNHLRRIDLLSNLTVRQLIGALCAAREMRLNSLAEPRFRRYSQFVWIGRSPHPLREGNGTTSDVFAAVPNGMEAFSAVNQTASGIITAVGSADSAAMLNTAAAALGPIGALYLAAYGPAQASNLAGTLLVGGVHAGVGAATSASKSAVVAADTA
jgi:hypothetical protein